MGERVDVTSLVTPINQASVCVCVGGGALNAISGNLSKKLKKIRLHITFSLEFVQRNTNQS